MHLSLLAPQLLMHCVLQVCNLANNPLINGTYPSFVAYRVQSLPVTGVSITCVAQLNCLNWLM